MTLKNRDGTPFRLKGTIPFMREQQMWDSFLLHNFTFKGVTVADGDSVQITEQLKLGFVEELADLVRPEDNAETHVEVPPIENVQVKETPPTVASILKNSPNKVLIYCLPGVIDKSTNDILYGEIRPSPIKHGEPFVFEGIVVYGDDITLSIWSPTDQVTVGSVLFPKNKDKRWWRVVSRESNMQGWMLNTTISDFQPKFRY